MKALMFIFVGLVGLVPKVQAQLTIDACQQKARQNYPLVHQMDLINQTESYNLSNASKGYLPQVSVSMKATYQSEVTQFPLQLPNIQVDPLSKDQYQAAVEVNQLIYDGGMIRIQKEVAEAGAEVDRQKLEVELYTLNERVNQVFFGALLLREQLIQLGIFDNDLKTNYDRAVAGMKNGVANEIDLAVIKVEQLKVEQRKTDVESMQTAYLSMLSTLVGERVVDAGALERPVQQSIPTINVNRPELTLFDAQTKLLGAQSDGIISGNLPKVGAFFQGGYGKPGLNMLKNEFSTFYIGGIRLSWNLSGYYSQKNQLGKIKVSKAQVLRQQETFLFNTKLKSIQQENEILKLQKLVRTDNEIVNLRNNIRKASEAKVEYGTLSASDLMRDLNAEDLARQDKALHDIQLLLAIFNLKNTLNN